MVPKSDGTLCLCMDFRKVNAVTVRDPFPLPRVEDLLDRVGKSKYLTKLDMTRGYWQVPLDEESIPVSAFVTPSGHFQWRFMPFGLRNAPATCSVRVYYCVNNINTNTRYVCSFTLPSFFLQRINRALLNPFSTECVEWNSRIVVFW